MGGSEGIKAGVDERLRVYGVRLEIHRQGLQIIELNAVTFIASEICTLA